MATYRPRTEFEIIRLLKKIGKAGKSEKCGICGTPMDDLGSRKIGIGPKCYRKVISYGFKLIIDYENGKIKKEEILDDMKNYIDRISRV